MRLTIVAYDVGTHTVTVPDVVVVGCVTPHYFPGKSVACDDGSELRLLLLLVTSMSLDIPANNRYAAAFVFRINANILFFRAEKLVRM